MDESWHSDVLLRLRCLDPEQRWLLIHIQQSLNHEVLTLVNETLAELLKLDEARGSLREHLDILPGGQLALFLDALLSSVLAHLVRVDVAVVLANFPDESLCGILSGLQESFFGLEDLFLDAFWSVDVEHTR